MSPILSPQRIVSPEGSPVTFLSLTDNGSIDRFLADIPFFCVGLTGFAVFTFFVVMRRTNLLAVYLYASVLLAFVGSILDLAFLLSQVKSDPKSQTMVQTLNTVTGLLVAREICFGLSVGFRNIFFWGYATLPSSNSPRIHPDDDSISSFQLHSHHRDWIDFGWLRFILKWGLLLIIISIPILQIIWRLSKKTTAFQTLYLIEAILEVAASSLFIIQLILNSYLAPDTSRSSQLRAYTVPFFALLISLGVAVGGIVMENFSETTLGRFLQASELYILIIFVLVVAFRYAPRKSASLEGRNNINLSEIEEKGGSVPKPDMFSIPPPVTSAYSYLDNLRRRSLSRMSSIVAIRQFSMRTPSDKPSFPSGEEEPVEEVSKQGEEITTVPMGSRRAPHPPSLVDMDFALQSPRDGYVPPSPPSVPPQRVSYTFTEATIPSYYGVPSSRSRQAPASPSIRPTIHDTAPNSPQVGETPQARPISAADSFEDLLRQQKELDKSIAALRLFSPRSSLTSLPTPSLSIVPSLPSVRNAQEDSQSSQKHSSTSARSEFSLSNFPEPPGIHETEVATSPIISTRSQLRAQRKSRLHGGSLTSQIASSIDDILPPFARSNQFDSGGTQYDVTSFIGDLSRPGPSTHGDAKPSSQDSLLLQVVPEETNSRAVTPSSESVSDAHTSGSITIVLTTEANEADETPVTPTVESVIVSRYHPPALRPLLLGSGAPIPLLPPSQVPIASRARIQAGGFSRTRPMISGPRPLIGDNREEPGVFERPRRPPGRPRSR
jgi:hypothetical protein